MRQCLRITLNSEVWSYRMPLCTLSKFSLGMGAKQKGQAVLNKLDMRCAQCFVRLCSMCRLVSVKYDTRSFCQPIHCCKGCAASAYTSPTCTRIVTFLHALLCNEQDG